MNGRDDIPNEPPASYLKRRDPLGARRELAATEHGRAIAEASGLFEVPRILSSQIEQGLIEFEYIADGIELRQALVSELVGGDTLASLGGALAVIHRAPITASIARINVPWEREADGRSDVFLHGDFQIENILFRTKQNTSVFIDWSAPFWLGGSGNAGPAEIDLGVFILSLFVGRPFKSSRIARPERHARNFLRGYLNGGGARADINGLRRNFHLFRAAYISAHRGVRERLRMLSYAPSLAAANRFLHRLSQS